MTLFIGLFVVIAGIERVGARRRGLTISFRDYLTVGLPVTVFTMGFGIWWLS